MKLAHEKWYLWLDGAHDPALNMAVDETLYRNANELGAVLLRIYSWDRPSVSIGYVQKYEAAPSEGYAIVRRPTGGGVVFHDVDLTYTVVVPASHVINKADRIESYRIFHRAVRWALATLGINSELAADQAPCADRSIMQCFTTPTRYDVLGTGGKYAGSAQRRGREGILHQGSIKLDVAGGDAKRLTEVLTDAFKEEFNIVFEQYAAGDIFMEQAAELARAKYDTEQWNKYKKAP